MKTIKVKKRLISNKNVKEFVKTIADNYSVLIGDRKLEYLTIDSDRTVILHEEEPHYVSGDWESPSYADYEQLGSLPKNYDFVPEEAIWELKFEEEEK
jgi:hypothetical protein